MALSDSAGVGSALPSQVGVTSGWALTTDGTVASWASVGGSGVDTVGTFSATGITNGASISGTTITFGPADGTKPGMLKALGAVGSSPAAAGASLGTDGTLTLQPADGTHPGVVSTAAQTIAGTKTIDGAVVGTFGGGTGVNMSGNAGLGASDAYAVGVGGNTYINGSSAVKLRVNNIDGFSLSSSQMDLTGLGNGASIRLKSPDGTVYTASIANGGTWSIV